MADGLTLREAMRLQLGTTEETGLDPEALRISHGQWLEGVMGKLLHPEKADTITLPKGFLAKLRPYQQRGLNWLSFLDSLQLGMCLADDMGLGKTVQLLALLMVLKGRKTGKKPATSLLVLPASLLGNWQSEIQRFAPSLKYFLAHPSNVDRQKELKQGPDLRDIDLVITTYALCQRYAWLANIDWHLIVLDEAQAIKNPGTKQTRAVKQFKARNRIAMTGTPIENRLSDLWSLFDFLNPGLLGTAREFADFSKTLRNNANGYARLKRVVSPYILRRLKTDKRIISDLPDKVEMKTYAQLSKKQIVLYQSLVHQLKETLEEQTEGIQRRGIVLASLMKFKQLCNHPDQYTGQSTYDETHSGKFQQLRALCETIHEKREKVLIFTQFKEIIAPLHTYLETLFKHPGLVLHGSVAVKKRKALVDRFQSNAYVPFMILSLKAGGVGLNLTAANHVIHFDRWWNPAVENQATDRCFRIGQHKNVVVHKFITQGTIEEKIDKMLTEKAELSDQVIGGTGEQWITEMNNQQLMELFTLSL
jgi:non-specific serine/threonine protein kinase